MTTLLLRYHVAEPNVHEVVRAVETAFTGLERASPAGIRFSYYRVADTAEFVGLLELDPGTENPLLHLEPTRALKSVVDRVALGTPPLPRPLHLLARYGR
ncbi:MAG: hypothetical protein DIU78_013560 [Pseudomonadota bacterium]